MPPTMSWPLPSAGHSCAGKGQVCEKAAAGRKRARMRAQERCMSASAGLARSPSARGRACGGLLHAGLFFFGAAERGLDAQVELAAHRPQEAATPGGGELELIGECVLRRF